MNTPTTQLDGGRLVELLTRQRDYYQSLRALSDKQRTLIASDRPEMLLSILRDRQDLITGLARLNDELGPYRRNWDAMYSALPEAQRRQASVLLHEINGLLRNILRADQEDGALLSAKKQAIRAEMSGAAGGQTANAAYARQAAAPRPAADMTG